MQVYHLKEKYNRELLYTWKKESYVRQLKKNLEDYERKRFGVRDAYYEYQARNLGNIIAGQQEIVIPPSEEERRLNINKKYHQFLQNNPNESDLCSLIDFMRNFNSSLVMVRWKLSEVNICSKHANTV